MQSLLAHGLVLLLLLCAVSLQMLLAPAAADSTSLGGALPAAA